MGPRSWVRRNLGDFESHWLGSARGTSESSIGVEREVPCCSVSQECFDEVPLVGFRSIRYPEGNANTFLWDPSQRYRFVFWPKSPGFCPFPHVPTKNGTGECSVSAPPKDLTTLRLIQGGNPVGAQMGLSVKPKGHRDVLECSHGATGLLGR